MQTINRHNRMQLIAERAKMPKPGEQKSVWIAHAIGVKKGTIIERTKWFIKKELTCWKMLWLCFL